MNFADTLRALWRRWYIVVPGLILAIAVAFGAWTVVKPTYERVATQLLLPGIESIPENSNPFLYLGGLSNAADVLVTAVASSSSLDPILSNFPGAEAQVTRDGSTAGPVIRIVVNARSDADAAAVLDALVARTANVLDTMQMTENIEAANRISVTPITIDTVSTPQQRDRLIVAAGAGVGVFVLSLLLAGLVDGLSVQKRRRAGLMSEEMEPDSNSAVSEQPDLDPDDIPVEDSIAPLAAEAHGGVKRQPLEERASERGTNEATDVALRRSR